MLANTEILQYTRTRSLLTKSLSLFLHRLYGRFVVAYVYTYMYMYKYKYKASAMYMPVFVLLP